MSNQREMSQQLRSAGRSAASEDAQQASVTLREGDLVMRLARMGSMHQSRLSFMRVMLRKFKQQNWSFERPVWRIDAEGVGVATYRAVGPKRSYTLVAFAHQLDDSQRSDRVIATAWDTTFTLVDGDPSDADIRRLSQNVPLQEAGRITEKELVLSRANKSLRMFNYVVECLANGEQPSQQKLASVGYLMRTTAVYGAGKFGAADRSSWASREEFDGSFQPEMLSVWLIRTFATDLVEHIAACRAPESAVKLDSEIKRQLGVGNSTGLGMAPFLLNHPALIHHWIAAREKALGLVRAIEAPKPAEIELLKSLTNRALFNAQTWFTEHAYQKKKVQGLVADLKKLHQHLQHNDSWAATPRPFNALYHWAEATLTLEGQEQLVSLLMEPYGHLVDDLHYQMSVDESQYFRIDSLMCVAELKSLIEQHYQWALCMDFTTQASIARVWYVSAEKLEPRLGERLEEPLEPYEQPLAPGRDVVSLYAVLDDFSDQDSLAVLLLQHPEFRQIVRRLQITSKLAYAEIRDNTIASDMLPIELLRCKLAFFGATKFDPRSDRWVRVTLFQGSPYPAELDQLDPDDLAYPALTASN